MKFTFLYKKFLIVTAIIYASSSLFCFGMNFNSDGTVAVIKYEGGREETKNLDDKDIKVIFKGDNIDRISFSPDDKDIKVIFKGDKVKFFGPKLRGDGEEQLSQKIVDDMRQVLRDVGVEKNLAEGIAIKPISSTENNRHLGCVKRNFGGKQFQLLDEKIELNEPSIAKMYGGILPEAGLNSVLYHEAIHLERHGKSAHKRAVLDEYHKALLNDPEESIKLKKKSIKLKQGLAFSLGVSMLGIILEKNNVGVKGGYLENFGTGVGFGGVGMSVQCIYEMIKNSRKLNRLHLSQKDIDLVRTKWNDVLQEMDYNKIKELAKDCPDDHFCNQRSCCLKCARTSYAVGKYIRMKQEFEADVGSFVMVSDDRYNNAAHINYLKRLIARDGDEWTRREDKYPTAYEILFYTKYLMQERRQGEDCLEGLASCADKYLQERIQGTLREEAKQYPNIEKHIKARREKEEFDYLLS